MNNEMSFEASGQKFATIVKMMAQRPVAVLTRYYSDVLERQLDSRQTWALIWCQIAFVATVFPSMSLFLRALCLAWLVGAVLKCREVMES